MSAAGLPHYLNQLSRVSPRLQRQVTTGLAGVSLFYHVALCFLPPAYRADIYDWPLGIGLGLSLLAVWVSLRNAPLRSIYSIVFSIMACWMTADMLVGILAHQGVTMWMVLDLLTATLIVLALLPIERGLIFTFVLYFAFVVISILAGKTDPILLLNLGFLLIIAAYLTLHGSYISSERAQNIKLRQELRFDGLTGALTRQSIEEELRLLCEQPQPQAMLMLLDLDYFKHINDQFGHLVGDQALQQVAQAAQDEIGPDNFIGRWGGEEFMVLVKVASAGQGEQIAERLRGRVSQLHMQPEQTSLPHLTISLGVVMLRPEATPTDLIAEADELLYAAKAAGRNRVRFQP